MRIFSIAYAATAIVFFAIDAVWLSLAGARLYRPLLGAMLADDFQVLPAALFYVIYIAGIVFFAILPALPQGSWSAVAIRAALLGFVCYATYDLTNQATLRNWPVVITIADLCWGTALTAVAATLGFVAARAATGKS